MLLGLSQSLLTCRLRYYRLELIWDGVLSCHIIKPVRSRWQNSLTRVMRISPDLSQSHRLSLVIFVGHEETLPPDLGQSISCFIERLGRVLQLNIDGFILEITCRYHRLWTDDGASQIFWSIFVILDSIGSHFLPRGLRVSPDHIQDIVEVVSLRLHDLLRWG